MKHKTIYECGESAGKYSLILAIVSVGGVTMSFFALVNHGVLAAGLFAMLTLIAFAQTGLFHLQRTF